MKRSLILLYGIIVYALFLAAFLYLIGFVESWFGYAGQATLLRGIDEPPVGAGAAAWLINLGLIALFGVQHSVMARRGFKEKWTKVVSEPAERSTFVLATVVVLALAFWLWRAMPSAIWSVEAEAWRWLLYGVSAIGWAIVLVATFLIDHFELFGLKQVIYHFRGKERPQYRFVTPALYRFVRHPLYLGFLLAFWVTPDLTVGHLLFAAGFTVYILIAIVFEERDLMRQFGDQYADYRRRVAMLIPHPFKKGGRRTDGPAARAH